MRIEDDIKLDFDDVLIRPERSTLSSRKDVDLFRCYTFRYGNTWGGVPIIAANMDTVGTFEMGKAFLPHMMSVALQKHYSIGEIFDHLQIKNEEKYPIKYNDNTWYSMGMTQQDYEKFIEFMEMVDEEMIGLTGVKVCIDVANGYQENFVKFVGKVRNNYPNITIMAGNVVTSNMTEQLILAGADIVKVGIGPGSVCTTRTKTGVGYPQLSAIIECAGAAHGLNGHVCADGGCRTPGDIAKAFGAGADFVMLGSILAGHDECSGELQVPKAADGSSIFEKATMKFYGMSSKEAQDKHSDGLKDYRASEGKCVEVPYKGPVENTVQEILGGLRSTCTYVGAQRLKDLSKCVTFIRVNRQKNDIYGVD